MATDFLPNWVLNDIPFKSDTAILVTSWMGHLKWMKYTFESYRKTGKFVILALDTHLRFDDIHAIDTHMPPSDILAIPNVVVMKHATWEADKRNGWLWNVVYAASIILGFDNFKYIFTVNSDCGLDRPEGLDELIQHMGDCDWMPQSIEKDGADESQIKLIHSCSVLFKRNTFETVVNFIREKLKTNIPESYSPETLLVEAQQKFNFKLKEPESPKFPEFLKDFAGCIDHYASYSEDSTWKKIIGWRNLCAENDTAGIERIYPHPLSEKYYDLRNGGQFLAGYERESLMNYLRTNDLRQLWMFWDKNEDSWYDRREYPIEHYGLEPVYAKE